MPRRTLFTILGICFGIGIGVILALLLTVFISIYTSAGIESLGTQSPVHDQTYLILGLGLIVLTTLFGGIMGFLLGKHNSHSKRKS